MVIYSFLLVSVFCKRLLRAWIPSLTIWSLCMAATKRRLFKVLKRKWGFNWYWSICSSNSLFFFSWLFCCFIRLSMVSAIWFMLPERSESSSLWSSWIRTERFPFDNSLQKSSMLLMGEVIPGYTIATIPMQSRTRKNATARIFQNIVLTSELI